MTDVAAMHYVAGQLQDLQEQVWGTGGARGERGSTRAEGGGASWRASTQGWGWWQQLGTHREALVQLVEQHCSVQGRDKCTTLGMRQLSPRRRCSIDSFAGLRSSPHHGVLLCCAVPCCAVQVRDVMGYIEAQRTIHRHRQHVTFVTSCCAVSCYAGLGRHGVHRGAAHHPQA